MKRGFLLFSIMLFYVTSLSVILAQGITPAYAIDDIAVTGSVSAQDASQDVNPQHLQEQMEGVDLDNIEKYLDQINRDMNSYMPELRLKDMVAKLSRGELGISATDVLKGLLKYLFREMVANSSQHLKKELWARLPGQFVSWCC